jgi:3-phosphoshikimate 1-carboxyvinyltransferase
LGVSRLKVKESDRGAALVEEYSKMGVGIAIQEDVMIIRGGKPKSAHVQSHNDHRIAMSCAVAALAGEGEVEIDHAEAVGKSYPEFFTDIQRITGDL